MKKKRFIYFIILLALLILCIKYSDSILGFAGFLWSLVTPLILGCVIAYILNILVTPDRKSSLFYQGRHSASESPPSRQYPGIPGSNPCYWSPGDPHCDPPADTGYRGLSQRKSRWYSLRSMSLAVFF